VRSIGIAPALSGALTGLARKNNATQAKAWAEFPRPFGPTLAALAALAVLAALTALAVLAAFPVVPGVT
jgi:hypothetical protein